MVSGINLIPFHGREFSTASDIFFSRGSVLTVSSPKL